MHVGWMEQMEMVCGSIVLFNECSNKFALQLGKSVASSNPKLLHSTRIAGMESYNKTVPCVRACSLRAMRLRSV